MIGYTHLNSHVALWNKRISLWKWPKTLSQAVTQQRILRSQRVCGQVINMRFWDNFTSFYFQNVPERLKDPEGFMTSSS